MVTWRRSPAGRAPHGQSAISCATAKRGTCRAIASECLGREVNAEFCDQEMMRVCTNMFESMVRPCVDNARCIAPAQRAMCACRTGFVDEMGVCRKATDCSLENGGCDRLTTCSVTSGKVSCGQCPQGFFGDGTIGCSAPLTGLATSAGTLSPAFDARVQLSVRERVQRPVGEIEQRDLRDAQDAGGIEEFPATLAGRAPALVDRLSLIDFGPDLRRDAVDLTRRSSAAPRFSSTVIVLRLQPRSRRKSATRAGVSPFSLRISRRAPGAR